MAVLKCKQCGGTIGQIEKGIGICDYCDVKQTIISVNDEKIINFIDRANGFRIQQEFDKAMEIYEKVLEEVQNDSDIYYQIALCRYGVYYVDDPKTGRKIPTISRMQKTKFTEDADFKMAVKYATEEQNELYKEEGKYIDKLYDHIQLIVKNEKPYDIFICYKESDDNNDRTVDSVEAYKIYQELQKEGYKVFFSRVTLEDKIGTEYEPYIFAALYSSKIMIAIGSKKEYFEAPWVKNEWSRYCSLIKSGERKKLMPVYFDMDINDIPYEIRSQLQARNLKTLGFMQDLLRGIKKEIEKPSEIKNNVSSAENGNADNLLKRVNSFLEEGDFDRATEYCEKVLDIDAENTTVYLYKLLIEKKCKNIDELKKIDVYELQSCKEFEKVIKHCDEDTKNRLIEICDELFVKLVSKCVDEHDFKNARKYNQYIKNKKRYNEYKELIDNKNDEYYVNKVNECINKKYPFAADGYFKEIIYKEKYSDLRAKIDELNAIDEKNTKKMMKKQMKKDAVVTLVLFVFILFFIGAYFTYCVFDPGISIVGGLIFSAGYLLLCFFAKDSDLKKMLKELNEKDSDLNNDIKQASDQFEETKEININDTSNGTIEPIDELGRKQ